MTTESAHTDLGYRDEQLPVATLLQGPFGAEAAGAAVERVGGTVTEIRPTQTLYTPGRHISITFDATVEWPRRPSTEEMLVALADSRGLPEGVHVIEHPEGRVAVWRFPEDPDLPGVAEAMSQEFLDMMIRALEQDPRQVRVSPLVYRPTQRAVVKLSLTDNKLVYDAVNKRLRRDWQKHYLYLKIVHPDLADGICRTHDLLAPHVPVPECLAWWEAKGLLVLQGLGGSTLSEFMRESSEPPPSGEEVLYLLDALASAPAPDGSIRTIGRRAASHGRLLKAILPEQAGRVERITRRLADLPPQPLATMHGDFYDSQVLVADSGRITGLLDLDGVGTGERIDDLASMLGRVWSSARSGRTGSERYADYADELLESFSSRVDPRQLCIRAAGIIFGRATGPFRRQASGWREQTVEAIEVAEDCVSAALGGELPSPRG